MFSHSQLPIISGRNNNMSGLPAGVSSATLWYNRTVGKPCNDGFIAKLVPKGNCSYS